MDIQTFSCKDYRVTMLSTLYISVSGIIMSSLEAIGQFQHGRINFIELTELTVIQVRTYGRFNPKF